MNSKKLLFLMTGMIIGALIYHFALVVNEKHILAKEIGFKENLSQPSLRSSSNAAYLVASEENIEEWEIIRELEDELEMALNELSEIKATEQKRKLENLAKKERQRQRMKRWAERYDIDKRKENASRTIKRVGNELKGHLDLPTKTAKQLHKLLENKAHREIEINESIRRLDKQASDFDRQLAYEQVKSEKAIAQNEFEQEVAKVLDEEQIQKYLELEQSKYQLRHNDTMKSAANRLIDTFTDLSEYQKGELSRYYNQKEADLDSVRIGTHGVGARYYANYFNDREALSAHLINTLTPEQYQHYLNTRKKRKNK